MCLSPPVSETWVKFIPELSTVCGGFISQELQRWLAGRGVRGAFSLLPPWGGKTLKYSLPAITLLEETLSSLDVGLEVGLRSGLLQVLQRRVCHFSLECGFRVSLPLKFKYTLKSPTQSSSSMGHKRGGICVAS